MTETDKTISSGERRRKYNEELESEIRSSVFEMIRSRDYAGLTALLARYGDSDFAPTPLTAGTRNIIGLCLKEEENGEPFRFTDGVEDFKGLYGKYNRTVEMLKSIAGDDDGLEETCDFFEAQKISPLTIGEIMELEEIEPRQEVLETLYRMLEEQMSDDRKLEWLIFLTSTFGKDEFWLDKAILHLKYAQPAFALQALKQMKDPELTILDTIRELEGKVRTQEE